jgi:hypothetical protein
MRGLAIKEADADKLLTAEQLQRFFHAFGTDRAELPLHRRGQRLRLPVCAAKDQDSRKVRHKRLRVYTNRC